MTASVKYTLNLNGDTLEVHGNSFEDVENELKKLEPEFFDTTTDAKQVAMAKGVFSTATARTNKPKSAAPPSKDAPKCEHGPANHAKGINQRTSKPYHGWYCNGRKPNKCDPILVAECNCNE